jgi:putative tryptophan/tyrosine transport system substrate-binding protein
MGRSRLSQRKSIVRSFAKRDIVLSIGMHTTSGGRGRMAIYIRRREFIFTLGGAAAAWPLAARAQQTSSVRKVGFLYPGPVAAAQIRIPSFLEGLRSAGFRVPEEVELVSCIADGDPVRLSPLTAELIDRKVDVIAAISTGAVHVVRAATAAIPIVAHDLETDPVATGLVASLARPGGNITGFFFDFPEFRTKWLQLLQEAIPRLSSVAALWDPATGPYQLKAIEEAAGVLRLNLQILEVRSPADLDPAFLAAAGSNADAVLILSSPIFGANSKVVADLALRHRLPAVTLFPDFARAGGLMAYGPNLLDTYRQLGGMVGKVLHGSKPANLPVELPTKFELVINLKTAKAVGVEIPTSILLRADEVIE